MYPIDVGLAVTGCGRLRRNGSRFRAATLRGVNPPPLAPPLPTSDLADIFRLLGIDFRADAAGGSEQDLTLSLSHGLIGAAEQHAMRAEQHAMRAEQAARSAGATIDDIGEATGQAFMAAGCRTVTEDIALLSWRVQRTTQAIIQVNQRNAPADLMNTVALVSAALSGLLSAAHTMRNPLRDAGEAGSAVRASAAALDKALTDRPGFTVLADLLDYAD